MKEHQRYIRKLAKALPRDYYIYRNTFFVSENDIKEFGLGLCQWPYYLKIRMLRQINHNRSLKRAWAKNGIKGVKRYIKKYQ